MNNREKVLNRFLRHVEIQPNGCWIWKSLHCKKRYGHYKLRKPKKKIITAHRYSYLLFILESVDLEDLKKIAHLTLDHQCQTHDCVMPYHLEAVPRWVNELRGMVNQILKNRGIVAAKYIDKLRAKILESVV